MAGRAGWWRLVMMALGLGPVLAACTAPMTCTGAGCAATVSVDIASLAPQARSLGVTATVCAEGACRTEKVTFGNAAFSTWVSTDLPATPAPSDGMKVPVTLKVTQGTKVLLDISTTATLTQGVPASTPCAPRCPGARLVLAGGHLESRPTAPASS